MALIIAGDRSGVGKTTITLAILAYFTQQGKRIHSFKVGPDYIDPMFHTAVTGIPCRNLDPVLTSSAYVRQCFHQHGNSNSIVEGVMGLFDGIRHLEPEAELKTSKHLNDYGSTAHIARILDLPVALVLDCSRLSSSIAAIAHGYATLDPQVRIAGVILNKVASDRHLELLTTALNTIQMPVLGILKRDQNLALRDRHLGLIPAPEVLGLNNIFEQLAQVAKTSLNWHKLLPLFEPSQARTHPPAVDLKFTTKPTTKPSTTVKIAIAKDRAFNFYYQDNLDLLRELGAELLFWSPLADAAVPNCVQGLYFGGGFPELFASQLAANQNLIKQLQQAIKAGIPTYAECGGLMYLCQELIDLDRQSWSMVGAIPSSVTMESKLTLGYRQAIALQDSCIIKAKQTIRGHEFHHSQLRIPPANSQWQLQGMHDLSPVLTEGYKIGGLHASYLHLHWGECPHLAQRFIDSCRKF